MKCVKTSFMPDVHLLFRAVVYSGNLLTFVAQQMVIWSLCNDLIPYISEMSAFCLTGSPFSLKYLLFVCLPAIAFQQYACISDVTLPKALGTEMKGDIEDCLLDIGKKDLIICHACRTNFKGPEKRFANRPLTMKEWVQREHNSFCPS